LRYKQESFHTGKARSKRGRDDRSSSPGSECHHEMPTVIVNSPSDAIAPPCGKRPTAVTVAALLQLVFAAVFVVSP
jgi:hypothetical protein